jgi:molybdopterin converting factor small subunit
MKVKLSLYASLGRYLPDNSDSNSCVMEIEKGTTIRDLLDRLKIPEEVPKLLFLNGIHSQGKAVLKDGDEIGAFPPVAGGSYAT